jgi:hypothetical protein
MPLKIMKVSELTRPTRMKESIATSLPEFLEAMTMISHGRIKPLEAVEISVPKSSERGYKTLKFTFKRHLLKELAKLRLNSEYSVKAFTHGDHEIIQIVREMQPTKTKRGRG